MLTYIARRLLYSIPVLVTVSFLIFCAVSAVGDPLSELKMNPSISQVTLKKIEHEKHLDRPIPVRYLYWVRDAVTNKFGTTLLGDRPVWQDLKRVVPHTLQLIVAAQLLSILFAITIGVVAAIRQYSIFDYTATTFSFLAFATPVFWLALMLQIVFTNIFLSWHVRIFYTSGLNSGEPGHGFHFLLDRVQHLGLPVITLAVLNIAQYSRYMRSAMLDVVNSDYIRTARAKGLPEAKVTMKHAFRNALIPLVTVVSLDFGTLIGGAIVTETVYQLDGMGPYFIQNLLSQDVYPLMAWLMVTATAIIFFNLVADVVYGYLDPRIRYD
jgi:peptide/nickel transport system permease protein